MDTHRTAHFDRENGTLTVTADIGPTVSLPVFTVYADSLNDADDRLDGRDLRRVGCWTYAGSSAEYAADLEPIPALVGAAR